MHRVRKKASSICGENRGEEIKPQTQVPDKTNCRTFSDTRHRVQIVTSKLSWQCRKTQGMDHQARRVMAALSYKLFCVSVFLRNAVIHFCNLWFLGPVSHLRGQPPATPRPHPPTPVIFYYKRDHSTLTLVFMAPHDHQHDCSGTVH